MTNNGNGQVQTRERGERLVTHDDAVALFDTGQFEHMWRIAQMMGDANLVPQHLKKKPADCMLIVQQAHRWRMDPFALAQASFVVGGKLGYEGKAIAAVVNSRADLKQRLKFDVIGDDKQNMEVVVSGTFQGEDEVRTVTATWTEGRKLSQSGAKWEELPDQQLCYYAARKWARRHAPELIMGILADDEIVAQQRHLGPDHAKDIGGHSTVDQMDALAAKHEAATAPQEAPSEAGDDIVDTDAGEVTEGSPEPATGQHGIVHGQAGFDLNMPEQIIVHLGKRGAPPTFKTMDEARSAMAERLDEYVQQGAPAGAIDKLCHDNAGLIEKWDEKARTVWDGAVNDALDALAA